MLQELTLNICNSKEEQNNTFVFVLNGDYFDKLIFYVLQY